jgi:hypothetical protein
MVCLVDRRIIQDHQLCSADGSQVMFHDNSLLSHVRVLSVFRLGLDQVEEEGGRAAKRKRTNEHGPNTRIQSGMRHTAGPSNDVITFKAVCTTRDLLAFVHRMQTHASLHNEPPYQSSGPPRLVVWRVFPLQGCPVNGIMLFHGTDTVVIETSTGGHLAKDQFVSTNFANSIRYSRVTDKRMGYLYVYGVEVSKFTSEFFLQTNTGEYRLQADTHLIPMVPLMIVQCYIVQEA